MADADVGALCSQIIIQISGNRHTPVMTTGTTDCNGQLGFAFLLVKRQKKPDQVLKFGQQFNRLGRIHHIIPHRLFQTGMFFQGRDVKGVGQAADVKHQISLAWQPMLKPKGHHIDQHSVFEISRKNCAQPFPKLGCRKVALGHHFDDVVETFMLNLFYEGRLGCFSPVTYLDRTDVTVIRPFIYAPEKDIRYFASQAALPVIDSGCPANGNTQRENMKKLLMDLEYHNKGLRHRIFGAMQKAGLDGYTETRMRIYSDPKNEE